MSGFNITCDTLMARDKATVGSLVEINTTGIFLTSGVSITLDQVMFSTGVGITKDGLVTPGGPINLSGSSIGFPNGFSMSPTTIVDRTGNTQILENGLMKLTKNSNTSVAFSGFDIKFNDLSGIHIVADSIQLNNGFRLLSDKLDFPSNGTSYGKDQMAFVGGISIDPNRINFNDNSLWDSTRITAAGAFQITSATYAPININSKTLGAGTSTIPFTGIQSDVVRASSVFDNCPTQAALLRTQLADTKVVNTNAPLIGAEIGVTLQGTTGNISSPIYSVRASLNVPLASTRTISPNIMTHLYIDSNNNNAASSENYSAISIHEGGTRKLDCLLDIEALSGTVVSKQVNTTTIAPRSIRIKLAGVVHYIPLYQQTL